MNIILNNRPVELIADSVSVQQLLDLQKFTFKMLIIKINEKLVKREDYDLTNVKDGDKVDVIHLISGG